MRPSALLFVAIAFSMALAPRPAQGQDYYADIRPILMDSCVGCHSEAGIAWSMEDPEATYRRRSRIARAITSGAMPPWLAERGHQAYVGDLSLDLEVVDLVRRWSEMGYPQGQPRPDPSPTESSSGGVAHSFEPDALMEVLPGNSYLPDQSRSDDYRCFLVDWKGEDTRFVTGFRAVPGNRNVAHHVVVHAVEPHMAERFRELDAEEAGPGYQCFGGSLPDRLGSRDVRAAYEARYPDGVRELSRANFWLAHWAPGMDGQVFPEGTGIRIEPGTVLVVQMHYYSSEAPGERDAGSRIDIMTAGSVDRPAFHLAQTRGDWLGASRNETMVIPPGTTRTYGMRDNLGELLGYIGHVTGVASERIQALELHSANLHMHSFGHSGKVTLAHDTGRRETLLSVPRWNLAWQRDFTFTAPKVLHRERLEDVFLEVECTYRNDSSDTVVGGYGSMEEMCFNFSYIAVEEGESPTGG